MDAGPKHVLDGIDAHAYESYQKVADIKKICEAVEERAAKKRE